MDMKPKILFLDCPLHPLTMNETLHFIARRLEGRLFTQHTAVNVAKIMQMQNDLWLQDAIQSSDIINVDGKALMWGARFCGFPIPERVTGIDLFHRLLAICEKRRYAVYLLGAREDVLQQTVARIQILHPSLPIAGYHHGYFWDDEMRVVDKIASSGARLLFVGISSPRKEIFIRQWGRALGVDFVMGVGGAFDILAGRVNRAPVWMQDMGLEWFYRLVQEPRRLWRRYLVGNSAFILAVLKAKIRSST
jgi:N-acetylglucosaminyldiphosphoundecaprenol N-acetyl-beta-D-mannosaminyltransferase